MSNFASIIIALLLILLNGLFVAAEFAIVKIRATQIKTIKTSSRFYDKVLIRIHQQTDTYLSACQLGITLTSLGLGWIGEPAAAYFLHPLIKWLNIAAPLTIEAISFSVAFVVISFLHIVAGELLPKSISIRYPWHTSRIMAVPLYLFYYTTYPVIWLLNGCSNLLLKLFFRNSATTRTEFYSTNEIRHILSSSRQNGELSPEEAEIMAHTLDFADLRISELMRPKEDLICLNVDGDMEEILEIVLRSKFTRYPVFAKHPDNIVGLLHVKDLFFNDFRDKPLKLGKLIRPILAISARSSALETLKKFRQGTSHLALIYRARRLVGFVTLDNLLHVIIGKIRDEFHYTKDDWVKEAPNAIIVDGDCSIYSLERVLNREIPDNEEYEVDTVSQLIIRRLRRIPEENEQVKLDEFTATIREVEYGEIKSLLVQLDDKLCC